MKKNVETILEHPIATTIVISSLTNGVAAIIKACKWDGKVVQQVIKETTE